MWTCMKKGASNGILQMPVAQLVEIATRVCHICYGNLCVLGGVRANGFVDEAQFRTLCKQVCQRMGMEDTTFDAEVDRVFARCVRGPTGALWYVRAQLVPYTDFLNFVVKSLQVLKMKSSQAQVREPATPARASAASRPTRSILVRTELPPIDPHLPGLLLQDEEDELETAGGVRWWSAADSDDDEAFMPAPPRLVSIRVVALSGELVSSLEMDASSTVQDVAQTIMEDPRSKPGSQEDVIPVLLKDIELDSGATLRSFLCASELEPCEESTSRDSLELQVIWKPSFRVKDRVKVVRDLSVTIMYKPRVLVRGQVGQVLNVYTQQVQQKKHGASAVAETARKCGDALISFEGVGNCWVSQFDCCKLVQLEDGE
eukprot:TRINITY_DN15386_c0_g1_i1.p1 TRINITY_DN15386_c0_g1~~TRINITY_DN15386_c0_g1_i1.p1  ORF type:complete len:373 (+),score=81.44 TRINITY_DN15386_c0_g1_i1:36-1154(+)